MRKLQILAVGLILSVSAFGQTFEHPQIDDNEFDQVKAKVGADFAIQYQMFDNHADSALVPLGSGLNLPTANFTIKCRSGKRCKGSSQNLSFVKASQ